MICIQKIYGFNGTNHPIIETSWDVTPVTHGRTNEWRKVKNRALILVDQKPPKRFVYLGYLVFKYNNTGQIRWPSSYSCCMRKSTNIFTIHYFLDFPFFMSQDDAQYQSYWKWPNNLWMWNICKSRNISYVSTVTKWSSRCALHFLQNENSHPAQERQYCSQN